MLVFVFSGGCNFFHIFFFIMSQGSKDHFNITILGDQNAQKTSFILRKIKDNENDEPINDDYNTVEIILKNGKKIKADICDTAGQDDYKSLVDQFIEDADGFFVVFSATDQRSFQTASEHLKDVSRIKKSNLKAVLIGNDCDALNRQLMYKDGKQLAEKYHIPYIETTSQNLNYNIEEAFQLIGLQLTQEPSETTCNCRI